MKKYLLMTLTILTCLAYAEKYEIKMTWTPTSAQPEMILRHPTNVGNLSNVYCNLDCSFITFKPDWGAKSYIYDNPVLTSSNLDGSQTIKSNQILDPGNCALFVVSGNGNAECEIEIVNWPGRAPETFNLTVEQGQKIQHVTNLECAKDIGLRIIKATQKRGGSKWLWVKVIAEFDQDFLLNPITNTCNASLQDDHWFDYGYGSRVKVNRQKNKIVFGGSSKVTIKNKNNRIKIFAKAYQNYQGENMPVFINVNGYSGVQNIILDEKSVYKPEDE